MPHWLNIFWHWFEIKSGTQPLVPNPYYNFWSGSGSDIGELAIAGTLFGGFAGLYRHHNCHEKRCLRLAKHEYEFENGIKYKVCHVHHPAVDHTNLPTAADFAAHHAARSAPIPKAQARDAGGRFKREAK